MLFESKPGRVHFFVRGLYFCQDTTEKVVKLGSGGKPCAKGDQVQTPVL